MSDYRDDLQEQVTEGIDLLFMALNKMGCEDDVAEMMGHCIKNKHRTLQQNFWRATSSVIKDYATTAHTDLRNEQSKKWAEAVSEIDNHFPSV
jgi:hypothetical protein